MIQSIVVGEDAYVLLGNVNMTANPFKSLYNTTSSNLEIDLRDELDRTLNGASDETRKGRVGLVRRIRLDDNGEPIRCPCRNKQTDEPSRDSYCRYCLGMGFLWDERKMVYYKNEDSFRKGNGFSFYLQYDKDISDIDYLVEIENNKEGEPVFPVKRKAIFKVLEAHPYNADRGRLEFWQVLALEERKWSVYYGVKNRQY